VINSFIATGVLGFMVLNMRAFEHGLKIRSAWYQNIWKNELIQVGYSRSDLGAELQAGSFIA
jgi:hypothetical protein